MLAAVRADQGNISCGFPTYAQMLRTLSRLDPVPLGFPAAAMPGEDTTVVLRGPQLRAKLRELGLAAIQMRFEQTVAARVAATRAAVQVTPLSGQQRPQHVSRQVDLRCMPQALSTEELAKMNQHGAPTALVAIVAQQTSRSTEDALNAYDLCWRLHVNNNDAVTVVSDVLRWDT